MPEARRLARPARSGAKTTCCPGCPTARASWPTRRPPAASSAKVDPDGKKLGTRLDGLPQRLRPRLQSRRRAVHVRLRHGVGHEHCPGIARRASATPSSGSEFGYRNGAGKWPTYYLDSLPPVVDIGPGSPTGITFGYGAKFPAKYQDALFICDWSYGKLYAVHLKPEGRHRTRPRSRSSSTGTPAAADRHGRQPQGRGAVLRHRRSPDRPRASTASPTTAPSRPHPASYDDDGGRRPRDRGTSSKPSTVTRTARAVDDRLAVPRPPATASSARPPASPSSSRTSPPGATRPSTRRTPKAPLEALLALIQVSAQDPAHRDPSDPDARPRASRRQILEALDRLAWESFLSAAAARPAPGLRGPVQPVRQVPNGEAAADSSPGSTLASRRRSELNVELCNLLVYLEAPDVAAKTVDLLDKAPTQEEQIDYATDLRTLKTGWTPALRKAYFSLVPEGGRLQGRTSFARLPAEHQARCGRRLSATPRRPSSSRSSRPNRRRPLAAAARPGRSSRTGR